MNSAVLWHFEVPLPQFCSMSYFKIFSLVVICYNPYRITLRSITLRDGECKVILKKIEVLNEQKV
jgi:hypothetical protein